MHQRNLEGEDDANKVIFDLKELKDLYSKIENMNSLFDDLSL